MVIKSATSKNCRALDLEQLQMYLQRMLESNKFWLVLDDVWNEELEKWIELRDLFNQYLNELYSSFFLEDFEDVGSFYCFKMHDLALLVVERESFIVDSHRRCMSQSFWHLSFSHTDFQAQEALR